MFYKKMKEESFDKVEESLALTAMLLQKADSVFPHEKRNIERNLCVKNGVFARLKNSN